MAEDRAVNEAIMLDCAGGVGLAVSIPVRTSSGVAELARIEVWRRGIDGALSRETENYVVAASERDGVFRLSDGAFDRQLFEARQGRSVKSPPPGGTP